MTKWKKARGLGAGMEYATIDGMTVVRRRSEATYMVQLPRGKGPLVDNWGPFDLVEGDDPFLRGREWVDIMRAKGWFDADLAEWDLDRTSRAVSRLPRSTVIPSYFLKTADEAMVARGRGTRRRVLRLGGIDVHEDDDRRERWGERRRATFVLARPGTRPRAAGNIELDLDRASLDVLIDRLIEVRSTLSSDEAGDAITGHVLDGPMPESQAEIRERVSGMIDKRDQVDRLMCRLMAMTADRRVVAETILDRIDAMPATAEIQESAPTGFLN